MQDMKGAAEPTIEKLMVQNSKIPAIDPKFEQRTVSQEVFWRCGVCESNYHFNLDRVTSNGIKVTCNTCFNFFVLQKVGIMVDMDHMIMQDIGTADKIPSTQIQNAEKRGILPPVIDESEVSGRFNLNTLTSNLKKTEMLEVELDDGIEVTETPVLAPIPTNVESFIPPLVKSQTKQPKPKTPPAKDITAFHTPDSKTETNPSAKITTPAASAQTNPSTKIVKPTQSIPKTSAASKTNPFITTPAVKLSDKKINIQAADQVLVNSFKSFNMQKREFKIDQKHESTSVTFIENNPKRKISVIEKNLITISIWISGICIFSLLVVFAYDWYESRHQKSTPVQVIEETTPQAETKTRHGFPEMGE